MASSSVGPSTTRNTGDVTKKIIHMQGLLQLSVMDASS